LVFFPKENRIVKQPFEWKGFFDGKTLFFPEKEITILFGATGFKIKKNRQKLTSFSLNCDFLALFLVIL